MVSYASNYVGDVCVGMQCRVSDSVCKWVDLKFEKGGSTYSRWRMELATDMEPQLRVKALEHGVVSRDFLSVLRRLDNSSHLHLQPKEINQNSVN